MPSRHSADIRQVEAKTGRTLEDWCSLLEANGIGDRREAVNFLRDGYAVAHAFALAIADHCLRSGRDAYGDEFWDDESLTDRDDELEDETDTIPCASCQRDIYAEAAVCPYCHEIVMAPTGYPGWVVWEAIIALVGFLSALVVWII